MPEPGGSASAALLASLEAALGPAHVLTAARHGSLDAYEIDWRRRYHGRALAVARPGSTEEAAAVVRLCAQAGVAIVPQGGNTGHAGGGVPDASGRQVVLSLARLARIREIDAANLTLTAEAGCVLQQVQQAAVDAGLLFPLSLGSEGRCTIGGNLASNAGGTQVLRYGNARELCLGLEVVTAQGDIWRGLGGLRKDNTGYDLRDLFIGSEGTLGLITAATLRLFPRPASTWTAWLTAGDLPACVALLQQAQAACGPSLTGFEVMNTTALDLVARHFPQWRLPLPPAPWTVLLEIADHHPAAHSRPPVEALLQAMLDSGQAREAVLAETQAQAQAMWQLREAIPLAQAEEGLNVKHDIALPVSRIPAFASQADTAIAHRWPGARFVTFGHLGDGNLHYNVQAPAGTAPADFLATHEAAINEVVFDAVMQHGGSIAAEHGIGQLRRDELARRKPAVALDMMRAIKRALDPQGIFNPGRVV